MRERVTEAKVPTEKQVEGLIADLAAIQARIEGFTTTLSTEGRQAAPKMRAGGEQIVAAVAQLADQHGIVLADVTGATTTASLTLAQRLRPLAEVSRQLTSRLNDTITSAQGDCWWSATALYTALARLAPGRAGLERALQPVIGFFARGKRKKTPPPATPT